MLLVSAVKDILGLTRPVYELVEQVLKGTVTELEVDPMNQS